MFLSVCHWHPFFIIYSSIHHFIDPYITSLIHTVHLSIHSFISIFLSLSDCKDLLKRLLTASPDSRITMPEIFKHPWLNEGRTLPFQPAPYPNTLTNSQIDSDIIDHMTNGLSLGPALEMKHDLITNRATSHYAVYHLLASRLTRYHREFPSKVAKQQKTLTTPKKKVSKDQGFFDADDDVEISSVVSVPVRTSTRGGNRKPVSVYVFIDPLT